MVGDPRFLRQNTEETNGSPVAEEDICVCFPRELPFWLKMVCHSLLLLLLNTGIFNRRQRIGLGGTHRSLFRLSSPREEPAEFARLCSMPCG